MKLKKLLAMVGANLAAESESARYDAASLYIALLKKAVSNAIYDDDLDLQRGPQAVDATTGRVFATEGVAADARAKYVGAIWPSRAHTMIGMPRLDSLQSCVERVLADGITGDFIETGVWRGGASIFIRGILKAYGVTDRKIYVADSFEGLPPADFDQYPKESKMPLHLAADLAVSLDHVRRNFARYDLLDDQVVFVKGWFRDTLPGLAADRFALIRLDGDLYESTMDALVNLYDKVSPGGFVIIDDFNALQACNDAVEDFRRQRGITSTLSLIEVCGAYWRKEA